MLGLVLPWWARWGALALAGASLLAIGQMRGQRIEGEKHLAYLAKQAEDSAKLATVRERIVTKTEIRYRDAIAPIRAKGEEIANNATAIVSPADDARCIVPAGFVRSYNDAFGLAGGSSEPAAGSAGSAGAPGGSKPVGGSPGNGS